MINLLLPSPPHSASVARSDSSAMQTERHVKQQNCCALLFIQIRSRVYAFFCCCSFFYRINRVLPTRQDFHCTHKNALSSLRWNSQIFTYIPTIRRDNAKTRKAQKRKIIIWPTKACRRKIDTGLISSSSNLYIVNDIKYFALTAVEDICAQHNYPQSTCKFN